MSKEVVRAAWKLFQQHVGQGLPVSAVIYSHTHGDHWGGVRGIIDPRFEIMPGTKGGGVVAREEPYEADERQPIVE